MKLIRFGGAGKEKPGIILNEKWFDVSSFVKDYDEDFFENDGLHKLKEWLTGNPLLHEVAAGTRLGSVVARPSKIICIGLNYIDHAKETGAAKPSLYPVPKSITAFAAFLAAVHLAIRSPLVYPINSGFGYAAKTVDLDLAVGTSYRSLAAYSNTRDFKAIAAS